MFPRCYRCLKKADTVQRHVFSLKIINKCDISCNSTVQESWERGRDTNKFKESTLMTGEGVRIGYKRDNQEEVQEIYLRVRL